MNRIILKRKNVRTKFDRSDSWIKLKLEFENGCGPSIPHTLTTPIGLLAFPVITHEWNV